MGVRTRMIVGAFDVDCLDRLPRSPVLHIRAWDNFPATVVDVSMELYAPGGGHSLAFRGFPRSVCSTLFSFLKDEDDDPAFGTGIHAAYKNPLDVVAYVRMPHLEQLDADGRRWLVPVMPSACRVHDILFLLPPFPTVKLACIQFGSSYL